MAIRHNDRDQSSQRNAHPVLGSYQQPLDFKSSALTTELSRWGHLTWSQPTDFINILISFHFLALNMNIHWNKMIIVSVIQTQDVCLIVLPFKSYD